MKLIGLHFSIGNGCPSMDPFYGRIIGLTKISDNTYLIGNGSFIRFQVRDVDLKKHPPVVAILSAKLPDRPALAASLLHVAEADAKIIGAADHGDRESVYLEDPFGHPFELFAERTIGERGKNGDAVSTPSPAELNVDSLMLTLKGKYKPWNGLHTDAELGNLTLEVEDLPLMAGFYSKTLGLALMVSNDTDSATLILGQSGAHIRLITADQSEEPEQDSRNCHLSRIVLQVTEAEYAQIQERVAVINSSDKAYILLDPSGIEIELRFAARSLRYHQNW